MKNNDEKTEKNIFNNLINNNYLMNIILINIL